ncbi:rab proteins geranylgeranyltransferase component A 1-like [Plectropomus leopardus]|uniref:rab proteins geranylgeranyltransferase component A 1-like n=1 Tax=Plectropomus leopardus TaxID=160734 RepID=UPI001C4AA2C7|nr:rab proteins geranylgeranyltransferase component A 1-like [Plectropomus leopardus]
MMCSGLAESVAAAAFSRVGQRVLHLDRRSYYAANWASFTFNALLTWIQQQQEEPQPEEAPDWSSLLEEGEELIYLSNDSSSVSNLQVFCFTSEEDEEDEAPNTTEEDRGGAEEDAVKEASETESADSKEEETQQEDEETAEDEQRRHTEGEEPEAELPSPTAAQSQSEPSRKKMSYAQLVKEGRRFNIDLVSKVTPELTLKYNLRAKNPK